MPRVAGHHNFREVIGSEFARGRRLSLLLAICAATTIVAHGQAFDALIF